MGADAGVLSQVLFGQGRRSILALLYGHADEQFYLREIARRAGTGIGATQRELGQLTDAGLLHRLRRGNQVYYRANRENPIFEELKSILAKTSGIRDTLQEGLARLADRVKLAFVYGSIARGEEKASSAVDLMVVGNVSFQDVAAALAAAGYRASRENHHYRVIQSLELTLGKDAKFIRAFDAFRKKRNVSSYDIGGGISHREVEEMIGSAQSLQQDVEQWIRTNHSSLL